MNDELHLRLALEAERVRWRLGDLDFGAVDTSRVRPGLVALVKEIAYSELTTFSATRRFLNEFEDDVDFTQWLAVWYFEETRHPQALGGWLARFGVVFDEADIRRGRVTTPFLRSRTATLVMNVISETVASAAYASLARTADEPVLRQIAKNLAGDEARHGASFVAYARRQIARAADADGADGADGERRAALKALWLWLGADGAVRHPVNEMVLRVGARDDIADITTNLAMGVGAVRERVCRLVGAVVGASITNLDDVQALLR